MFSTYLDMEIDTDTETVKLDAAISAESKVWWVKSRHHNSQTMSHSYDDKKKGKRRKYEGTLEGKLITKLKFMMIIP